MPCVSTPRRSASVIRAAQTAASFSGRSRVVRTLVMNASSRFAGKTRAGPSDAIRLLQSDLVPAAAEPSCQLPKGKRVSAVLFLGTTGICLSGKAALMETAALFKATRQHGNAIKSGKAVSSGNREGTGG